jgi:hypothetical protein
VADLSFRSLTTAEAARGVHEWCWWAAVVVAVVVVVAAVALAAAPVVAVVAAATMEASVAEKHTHCVVLLHASVSSGYSSAWRCSSCTRNREKNPGPMSALCCVSRVRYLL